MRVLFPDIKPYATQRLAVDSLHTLYIEECGNPSGLPVLFLHGGPGAGCEPMHRRFFDPQRYRIVLFDQRGSGQSSPHAELRDNTTWHLVADIEKLREHLNIDRWVVFGGSWGSTLALAYAETHPDRVLGLILRGVFLCRDQDIHWFYQHGANRLFPDLWEHFLAPIPAVEQHDLIHAYHRRLTGADELERLRAARAWSTWEGATLTLEHAAAVSLEGGAAYTVYLSDFAIDAASLSMFSTPSVPETGTLFTVSVTIFNAQGELPVLEAGQVVEADRPFGELTFIVTTNEGATFDGNSAGQQGTVTLTAVGDPVCGTVEYSDNVRSLSGSFLAPTRSF